MIRAAAFAASGRSNNTMMMVDEEESDASRCHRDPNNNYNTPKRSWEMSSSSSSSLSTCSHSTTTDDTTSNNSAAAAFDCSTLQRSLKRVRLTTHIGELRLQKDIRHAVCHHEWTAESSQRWRIPHNNNNAAFVTVRVGSHPMELILEVLERGASNNTRYRLVFPPLYPHQPPTITISVVNIRRRRLVIAQRPDETYTDSSTHVLHEWSPVCRLTDICDWIVEFHHTSTSTNMAVDDPPQPQPTETFFQPGRFHVGYKETTTRRRSHQKSNEWQRPHTTTVSWEETAGETSMEY